MIQLPWLNDDPALFPPLDTALDDPDGLLAAGGDLKPQRIVNAYAQGIFPWYEQDQPILWWSPNPRTVLHPSEVHLSRSLRKQLRKAPFELRFDTAFSTVMQACAAPRRGAGGTWITPQMHKAYCDLHELGITHSVEMWQGDDLVGGLYGLALGRVFFGESMFARRDNASKIAFASLCYYLNDWGFELIDCQVASDHLFSLGAYEIPREEFAQRLNNLIGHSTASPWPCELYGLDYPF
ncbi:leucyl/phenylalanyl-tRNA--protein transferase [Gilvimarinus sp. DA14]|uniref:leucyl/phenylalanyl-tRNA--protein transferase n=1 Tax=Gilvimarinus sp. DA14 TaxID=2956798 RepID=UPI0020B6BEB2|nr:leucyl/phenylalanyl-tRNA--protein transferase [Gilvimarinus sp. DA14]UTF60323.1 leucyl/phenylalanyl-tRNA--protein transferase [Gilvimarinus sp. DA14]